MTRKCCFLTTASEVRIKPNNSNNSNNKTLILDCVDLLLGCVCGFVASKNINIVSLLMTLFLSAPQTHNDVNKPG